MSFRKTTIKRPPVQHRGLNYLLNLVSAAPAPPPATGNIVAAGGFFPDGAKFSPDGINWSDGLIPIGEEIYTLAWRSGSGYYGTKSGFAASKLRTAFSAAGDTAWSFTDSNALAGLGASPTAHRDGLCFGGGVWIICIDTGPTTGMQIYSSSDFITWTLRQTIVYGTGVNGNTQAYWDGAQFVVMLRGSTIWTTRFLTSPDGITWADIDNVVLSVKAAGNPSWFFIFKQGGFYLISGVDGSGTMNVFRSAALAGPWSTVGGAFAGGSAGPYTFASNGTRIVCGAGINRKFGYSDNNGATWTIPAAPPDPGYGSVNNRFTYRSGVFVMIYFNDTFVSADGATFTLNAPPLGDQYRNVV